MSSGPERTCAVTRAAHRPDELIRFVCNPEGEIVPDVACRLPGRGVWIACSRPVVEAGVKSGAFARSLRRRVAVPEGLAASVDGLLARHALEALSLASKSGQLVAGFGKVETAIGSGQCAALVHAADAAEDGVRKLDQKAHAAGLAAGSASELPILRILTSSELSLALGRPNVIHAALMKGGAAARAIEAARRLERFRAMPNDASRASVAGS